MKITRGHYNRKLLTFGAMLFLAIALISTGFAAWIMSSGAETGFDDGNLSVGVVTESDLKFSDYQITAGSTALLFEPAKGDVTGDIKGNGTEYESLTFTLTTTLTPIEYLDEIQISMTFPETVVAAHNAGYIVLPDCALLASGQVLTIVEMNESKEIVITNPESKGIKVTAVKTADGKGLELTVAVEIAWGSKFGGENPSTYLDEKTSLSAYEKKVELYNFKKTIYGLSFENETDADGKIKSELLKQVFDHTQTLQYSLDLFATVN